MNPTTPFFSIIIPTYNRPTQLLTCLTGLLQLNYPKNRFEIIVVDDGSPIPLKPWNHSSFKDYHITLLRQENSGPSAARNKGAHYAKGKILAFTDDDCLPERNWLNRLEERFKDRDDIMVGGKTINRLRENLFSTTSQMIIDAAYAYYNCAPENAHFIASNNLALPADAYHKMNGFHPNFRTSEDREICDRWKDSGKTIVYSENAIIYHAHALGFFSFCRQHFNYGRGALSYTTMRKHRPIKKTPNNLKFHLYLPVLLKKPLSKFPTHKVLVIIFLFFLWEIINAAGFFYEYYNSSMVRSRSFDP